MGPAPTRRPVAERVHLVDTAGRRARLRLGTLHDLTRSLLDDPEPQAALPIVARGERDLVAADWCWVVAPEPDDDGWSVVAVDPPTAAGAATGSVAGSAWDELLCTPTLAFVDDAAAAGVRGPTAGVPVGALLVVPLAAGPLHFGTVLLANRRGRPAFGPGDVADAEDLACDSAGALALQRAWCQPSTPGSRPGPDHRADIRRPAGVGVRTRTGGTVSLPGPTTTVGPARRLRRRDDPPEALLATVAHELRTPLTSIVSFSKLLLDEHAAEGRSSTEAEYLDVVVRNARRLQRLVVDLTSLAQLEAGRLHLERGPVSAAELVEETVRMTADRARLLEVTIAHRADPGPPIHGDFDRLVQLVDNLVSNAVKYSHRGGTVSVRAQHRPGRWRLEVADRGIGIPAGELAHIGERFYRASNTRDVTPGTGLGMSIVHAIADLHGARVSVTSRLRHGTTVTVDLPEAP